MNISRENIDALSAVIKIEVAKNDYQERVDKTLKSQAKKVQMPGFRAGKVPASMVAKMYGKGILKDVLDKIFIPFFTTKPNGSGIGLSLSKQILKLHNGTITAQSIPEKETVFTLTF